MAQQVGQTSVAGGGIQRRVCAGESFSTDPTTSDQLLSVANYGWASSAAVSSGNVSGTKATAISLTSAPPAGSTAVCSMEQIGATGRYKQVIDITPGDNGSGNLYHQLSFMLPNSAVTGLSAGDWVRFSMIVEVGGAAENLGAFRLRPQIAPIQHNSCADDPAQQCLA